MEYEADSDYWEGYNYAMYFKDGIFIDVTNEDNLEIYGVDNSKLDLLYDLIKADLVERVDDKNAKNQR